MILKRTTVQTIRFFLVSLVASFSLVGFQFSGGYSSVEVPYCL